MSDELRPQNFRSGSSVWHCSVGEKLCLIKNLIRPIKLSGRALYDDGQMVNRNVINNVTWVEFVFNKHGWRSSAEICVDRDVLEDIDNAFILKEEQRNAIKAFVDQKEVFAVLPTGSGKSLMYQLAPWSTLWSYYVALIGSGCIQLSEEAFFFLVRLKHAP